MSKDEKFSNRMIKLRKAMELNQEDFAQRLGVSRNYVSMIESGREPSEQLIKLFTIIEEAHYKGESKLRDEPSRGFTNGSDLRWLPILSWAHAGEAVAFEELPEHMQETIPVTCKSARAFALRIEGDSMEPRCVQGDLVIVMPDEEPRNGCLVVAKLSNDGVVLRRYSKLSNDNIRLSAYNPVYPPMDYTPRDFAWIYPVHSTVRKEWSL